MLVFKAAGAAFGMKAMARFVRKPPPRSPESVKRLYAERPGYGEWAQAKVLATSPVMARAMMAELASRADRLPELRSLDLPVLVIAGEHDMPGFVDGSQAMADAIPGATLAVLARRRPLAAARDPRRLVGGPHRLPRRARPAHPAPAPETEGTA